VSVDVWVEPTITIAVTGDTICDGGTTDLPVTSGNTTTNGIRYTWTVVDNANVTGEIGSAGNGQNIGTSIQQTLTNNSTAAQRVTYTITPWAVNENGQNNCSGTPVSVDVWVEPTITIAVTGDTICDGGTTDLPVTSGNTTTNGIRYTWTVVDNANVTGEIGSAGNGQNIGTSIQQTLTNNSTAAQRVTYTITPWAVNENGQNNCSGTPVSVDVWVEPTITIAVTGDTICDGGTTDLPVTSGNTTTNGIRYTWTVVDNANVTGEIGSAGNGQNIGTSIQQTLTNNSTAAQRVTYTITPWAVNENGQNNCSGTPVSVDVWVEPTITIAVTGDTICDGGTTDLPVTSGNTTTNGIRYTWTVVDNANVTGEIGSAGNGQNIGTSIQQTLTNNSTAAQRVTYTITPWAVNENGQNNCSGTPVSVDVWVEPTITIAVTGDTICDGGTTDLPVTSGNTTTNGIRYTWTVVDNANVTGEIGSAGNGQNIGTSIQQTLTNNSTAAQRVTYTITPWAVNENGQNNCSGTPVSVDVWVEPTITIAVTGDTICDGGTTDLPVTSGNTTTNGIRYTWTVVDNANVTGEIGSAGNGQNIGTSIQQTLTNNSTAAQRVTYTITPWAVNENGQNNCSGTPVSVDVWVEPTITIAVTGDTICDGGTTDLPVTSGNTTTNGIRYTWTVVDNANVTGEIGSAGNGQNIGTSIQQTLTNNSTAAQRVTYTITPWAVNENGQNNCSGTPVSVDVWVEPTITIAVTGDTICDGGTTDLPVTSGNTTTNGIRYTWTVVDNANVTGEIGSAGNGQNIGTSIQQTLTNNSTAAQRVTYTITPWAVNENGQNNCSGTPVSVDVWVEPTITIAVTGDTICDGGTTDLPVTSGNTTTNGIRYTWTVVDNANVTGEIGSAGNGQNIGTSIQQTLTNNSTAAQRVTYTITPWAVNENGQNNCSGTPVSVDVWVEPTITIAVTGDTICDGGTTDLPVTSGNTTTNGIRYTWTVVDNANVTGEIGSAGNGQNIGTSIQQTLTNNSTAAQRVTYTITPWAVNENGQNNCSGTPVSVDVWVEPTITIAVTGDTICDGGTTDLPVTSGNTTTNGIRYTWTVVDNANVTGEIGSAGNGQNIGTSIQQTLTNNSTAAQRVTYTITPWAVNENGQNNCSGTPVSVDVWVEPTITIAVTGDTICDGGTTDLPVTSGNTTTNGIRYTWTVVDNANVTGEIGSAGNGQNIGTSIQQTLTNNSTAAQRVTYTITPWAVNENGQNNCSGTPVSVDVWVEPTVSIDATPESDTLCSGDAASIDLNSINVPTNPVLLRYQTRIPYGVTVTPGSGSALVNGSTLTDVLVNTTDTAKQVLFIISPYIWQAGPGPDKCPGVADTVEVWVEPVPKVSLAPIQDTICTSLRPSITSGTVTRSLKPVRLYYEAVYSKPDVEVFYEQDTFDLAPGITLVDSIVNHSIIPQRVTFIVYPYLRDLSGNRKCTGILTKLCLSCPELKIAFDSISTYIGRKHKMFQERITQYMPSAHRRN
jgi:hypothetical protein